MIYLASSIYLLPNYAHGGVLNIKMSGVRMQVHFRNILFSLIALSLPMFSYAGGASLYEIGTADVGLANAGTAARAQDSSTVGSNPAGMTRLSGDQYTVAGQMFYGDAPYELDGNGSLVGESVDNAVGWVPGLSAFYSHSVNNQLKVGFGFFGNFGSKLSYGDEWAGRNLVTDTTLIAFALQPTVAYKFDEKWSVGLGVSFNYGHINLKRINSSGDKAEQKDNDWDITPRIGLLYEPTQTTRYGLVWSQRADLNFDIDSKLNIGDATYTFPLAITTYVPEQVMASAYHQLDNRWAIMGNLGWQNWSEFADTSIETNQGVTTVNLQLKDTWHAAIGAQYIWDSKTTLSAGIAYDSSFYKDNANGSIAVPSGPPDWRFGVGMQKKISKEGTLGVALEYVMTDTSKVQNALISGSYDNPDIIFIAVNYSKHFE